MTDEPLYKIQRYSDWRLFRYRVLRRERYSYRHRQSFITRWGAERYIAKRTKRSSGVWRDSRRA